MTEFKSGVDLSLMEGVLRQYQDDATSLIMILQQAQSIYGYLPQEVIYHVAERTGNSPAKVMGVATFYSYFRLQPMGTDYALRRYCLPRQRLGAHSYRDHPGIGHRQR